ncbi:hypothetical protein [Streptomyces melanogenes]|uniref:hypothetical protein n=1 Tax=Streptomyces melanogenes TaxID=67326 RepID=UPI00167E1FB4|nr:hypothetical protein [Streptomyces melanogenes]GGP31718.1 lipoprotein [Streptomyces melanogenes]
MGAIRIASATLLGAAALSLATPAAAPAADGGGAHGSNITSFGFSVTPSTIAPGGTVTLNVTGCPSTATASSGVFNTVTISPNSSTTAQVDFNAKRGATYTVTFMCGGERGTTDLTITGGLQTLRPTTSTTTAPSRGVRGGLGGTSDGVDLGEIAIGLALVAAAGGGLMFYLRRRDG